MIERMCGLVKYLTGSDRFARYGLVTEKIPALTESNGAKDQAFQ
jgi:hypothetical protein